MQSDMFEVFSNADKCGLSMQSDMFEVFSYGGEGC